MTLTPTPAERAALEREGKAVVEVRMKPQPGVDVTPVYTRLVKVPPNPLGPVGTRHEAFFQYGTYGDRGWEARTDKEFVTVTALLPPVLRDGAWWWRVEVSRA